MSTQQWMCNLLYAHKRAAEIQTAEIINKLCPLHFIIDPLMAHSILINSLYPMSS